MHKGFLLVGVPLCFEVGIFSLLLNQQNEMARETSRINNSRIISNTVNQITRQALTLEDVFKTRSNPVVAAADIRAGTENLIVQFNKLELLTRDDARLHQDVLNSLQLLDQAQKDLTELKRVILSDTSQSPIEAARRFGPKFHDTLRNVVSTGLLELASRSAQTIDTDRTEQMRSQAVTLLKVAVALSALIALLSAWLFTRHMTSRLKLVVRNADRLGERQALLPALGGNDEIAELDSAVHQAAELINHLEQTREEIVGMVGHDIASPLSTIKVTSEALELRLGGVIDERGRELLAEIDANCDRILRISRDLLDMQRLESGMLAIEKAPTDLKNCLSSAVASTAGMCHNRAVQIEVVAPSVRAVVDEGRIEQVLTNLLTNAIKHSPRNGTVQLTMTVDGKRKEARISVCDSGSGIPEHLQDEIFERFKQASKEEHKQGTGLGLAISKALVEMHGGRIGVQNIKPKGSEFWVVLPVSAS
ncbi:MAG: HAMP domain-containing histidine kinase [Cyanobacteria bacterium REEB67]|nr:HAMP domain-containing histidine kinase [Cyanobacteria bacterium REEB67]